MKQSQRATRRHLVGRKNDGLEPHERLLVAIVRQAQRDGAVAEVEALRRWLLDAQRAQPQRVHGRRL